MCAIGRRPRGMLTLNAWPHPQCRLRDRHGKAGREAPSALPSRSVRGDVGRASRVHGPASIRVREHGPACHAEAGQQRIPAWAECPASRRVGKAVKPPGRSNSPRWRSRPTMPAISGTDGTIEHSAAARRAGPSAQRPAWQASPVPVCGSRRHPARNRRSAHCRPPRHAATD